MTGRRDKRRVLRLRDQEAVDAEGWEVYPTEPELGVEPSGLTHCVGRE